MKNFKENQKNIYSYFLKYYLGIIIFTFLITVFEFFLKTRIRLNCGRGLDFETKNLISAILIAPILEELVFRLGLTNKKKDFFISLLFSFIAFIYWYYPIKGVISKEVYIFIFYIITQVFLYLVNLKNKQVYGVYLSSIYFGLLHLSRFENCETSAFIIIFINTIPQMISGFCLAKLRLKSGVIYSIILHMIINLIAFGVTFVMN